MSKGKSRRLRRAWRRAMGRRHVTRFGFFPSPHGDITYHPIPRSTIHTNGSQDDD